MIERVLDAGAGRVARIRFSDAGDGDFRSYETRRVGGGFRSAGVFGAADEADLKRRRQELLAGRWTWLRQVHGADVIRVDRPGAGAGAAADGAVTTVTGAVLAVHTADCAPVAVAGGGVLGIAHAGWKGVVAGIIGAMVESVRLAAQPRDSELRAVLGARIGLANYEFGPQDAALVSGAVGCDVAARTSWGAPALDLGAAVSAALRAAGVQQIDDTELDTAEPNYYSHRLRGDTARMATAARLEQAQ